MKENGIWSGIKLDEVLSKEQTVEYLKQMKLGDKEAREQLITHNIRLVIFCVNERFSNTIYDKEELVSIGLIGLIKGIDTFDIERSNFFVTYMRRCIENEILMFLRKNKGDICHESLETKINHEITERPQTIKDILVNPMQDLVADYEQKEEYQMVRQVIETLPLRERTMILLYFDEPLLTHKEISQLFGLSRSGVSRIMERTLQVIKEQLQTMDPDNFQDNVKTNLLNH